MGGSSAHFTNFGVVIDGPIVVDMKQVKARKDGVVRQSNEGVLRYAYGYLRLQSTRLMDVRKEAISRTCRARCRPSIPGVKPSVFGTSGASMENHALITRRRSDQG